jgi:hypothetical protein
MAGNVSGAVQYPLYLTSAGEPNAAGDLNADGTLAAPADWTTVGTGFTAARYPRILSTGDANGDGIADLYATTRQGALKFFAGLSGGGFAPAAGATADSTGRRLSPRTETFRRIPVSPKQENRRDEPCRFCDGCDPGHTV